MFEAPFLLWGALAAAVPVILHLTGRSQPVLHRFPAMRFILKSQRASSRALRLKHWLVLLLRIAALVMICLALARPHLGASAVKAGGSFFGVILAAAGVFALYRREFVAGALTLLALLALYASMPDTSPHLRGSLHGDIVIVLDQSMSMSYQESAGTRFDLARRQIADLLDRLSPDSRVALLLAGRNVERVQGRLTYRLDAVREKLKEATVTSGGLDIARALQAAEDTIARDHATRAHREGEGEGDGAGDRDGAPASIVFFTDMQRNGFESFAAGHAALPLPLSLPLPLPIDEQPHVKTPVVIVDVASDQARNGGVLEASLPGIVLPVDSTSVLMAKVRLPDKDRASLVELLLDGKRVDQKLVESGGRDVADVEFRFLTGAAGPHAITLHLADPDRLPLDQDYHVTYSGGRPDRALIVELPASNSQGSRGTGFFLRAALQPAVSSSDPQDASPIPNGNGNGNGAGGDDAQTTLGMSGLSCVVEGPGELTAVKLAGFKVVILADCGALSETSWAALQQWTNDGGGLFVWLGTKTDPASVRRYGLQVFAAHRGLLPGTIGDLQTADPPIQISEMQTEHPLLAHLTPDVSRELRQTKIRKFVKVTPDNGEGGGNVVLSANARSDLQEFPILLEKSYGRGRVLLCALDPGLECSDLARRGGSFVTLLLNSVHLLAQSDNDVNARLGQALELTLPNGPADGRVVWRRPDGSEPVILSAEDLNAGDGNPAAGRRGPVTVAVPRLETTGIHRFSWTPAQAKAPLVKLVAVNHDSSEIDLTKADRADVEKLLADMQPEIVRNFSDGSLFKGQLEQNAGGRTFEFAAALLIALLTLLIGESFLSNRFYRGGDETVAPASRRQNEVADGKR